VKPYRIPKTTHQTEITIKKSRFITSVSCADAVENAREFIADIREQMNDANHHVYAFRVGYGKSVIEGMSDDGEPNGTAGPPTLSVLRGSDIGDIVCVTTRYFGGTKLGTGGLVKAYTESIQTALSSLAIVFKVEKVSIVVQLPYHVYNIVQQRISDFEHKVIDETFAEHIKIRLEILKSEKEKIITTLINSTSGQIEVINQSSEN